MSIPRIVNNTHRTLLWLQVQARYHMVFALIAFGIFFVFGVVPMSKQIKEKYYLIKEMRIANDGIISNNAKLKSFTERQLIFSPFILGFRQHLPHTLSQQDYLVTMSGIAVQSDFNLNRFIWSQKDEFTNSDIYSIGFEGVGDVTALITGIENMRGAILIDAITVSTDSFDESLYKVIMQVRIFTL